MSLSLVRLLVTLMFNLHNIYIYFMTLREHKEKKCLAFPPKCKFDLERHYVFHKQFNKTLCMSCIQCRYCELMVLNSNSNIHLLVC